MARQRLTKEESELLLSIVSKDEEALDPKGSSGVTKKMREEIWNKVEKEFNEQLGTPKRTVKQLMTVWQNHRKRQKKVAFDVEQESKRPRKASFMEDDTTQQSIVSVLSTASTEVGDRGTPEPVDTTPNSTERTANPNNNAMEDVPTTPPDRPAPGTVQRIAEREMEARLNRLESMLVREVVILALREEEATLARAVKEKELMIKDQEYNNAKEFHDAQMKQMIETGKLQRRILEAELKVKEEQLCAVTKKNNT